ncbi:CRISPR-associated endonuclease Cas2 [Campylobacter geochelonis]|uniref:CRISPR-associated endoribonuclease Cas2 n=1 Tax=Campylobacter geochelonis TaxID=1780362 RepID=A0A128ECZ9_9BACT|nr:CRISPR-associated endonuclease Cas2 [Campylobacter geochelonis]QKF70400.1 CRISPR/Cas system-associated endoribonuclease Cas2 [Campylobacter geochelonis]CZE46367.1 CRISPR-associated endoribonuclease Cas2 [Campylobacter geochelonis]
MHYIICYDIAQTRRRTRLATLLEAIGTRANKSVFEAKLTAKELEIFIAKAKAIIEPKTDSVLIYPLCFDCMIKSLSLGQKGVFEVKDSFV